MNADTAEVVEFAFLNNIQRCEMFLDALSTNLKICQENERSDALAKMTSELEKAMDALNKCS